MIIIYRIKHDSQFLPPWYYGYVDYDPVKGNTLFALIPLNWLLRLGCHLSYRWDMLRQRPRKYMITVEIDVLCEIARRHGLDEAQLVADVIREQLDTPPNKLRLREIGVRFAARADNGFIVPVDPFDEDLHY